MPLNIPSGTTNDISFGPGVIYMDPWIAATVPGVTPTTDVGFISEDGVTVEITNETKDIMQGNPKLIEYTFSQTQGVTISLTSIEWDFNNFRLAIGAGTTNTTGAPVGHDMQVGGDPIVLQTMIQIQHSMAVTGNTMFVNVWKCVADGGMSIPLGADEHSFEMTFKAQRQTTQWASGSALDYRMQLIQFVRQTT